MSIPLAEAARIVRTKPTSPILSLVHVNWCPAQEGGRCTCDAAWQLRPVAKVKVAA